MELQNKGEGEDEWWRQKYTVKNSKLIRQEMNTQISNVNWRTREKFKNQEKTSQDDAEEEGKTSWRSIVNS